MTGPAGTSPTVPVRARLGVAAEDWRAAVRAGADQLVELGTADAAYVEACVRSVEENGPYIVLTPGVALAHAQPEEDTTSDGLTAAVLAEPVPFGHPNNDPVDLVLAFSTGGSHMEMIQALARALSGGLADSLRGARDAADAESLLAETLHRD